MDKIDFNTNPAGFPLESDAILGFMQSGFTDALVGLAKLTANGSDCIVSGCEINGTSVSDGWIFRAGELFFFAGGTTQDYCVITENVTQKANQNGTLVDRIFERAAGFGTGTGQFLFNSLIRINTIANVGLALNQIANISAVSGATNGWAVLYGCLPSGSNNITAGAAMVDGVYINVPAYSGGVIDENNPVYLTKDGAWTTTADPLHLKFSPYTTNRMETLHRNATHSQGSIIWLADNAPDLTTHFVTGASNGLGKGHWDGWAKANGNNGTYNIISAINLLVPIQRV